MEKKKRYHSLATSSSRIGDLVEEMNEREIKTNDIIYLGPSVSGTGYVVIYIA
jgi:hypothetical protein